MRPIGHLFHVFSGEGQRDISWPAGLAEHHQGHATAQIIRGIQGEAARGLAYGELAVIKTLTAEFAYLSIVETIQDAFGRMSQSVHSMVLPVADLIAEKRRSLRPKTGIPIRHWSSLPSSTIAASLRTSGRLLTASRPA